MLSFRRIVAYLLVLFLIFNIYLISLLANFNLNIKNESKIKNLINKPAIYSEIIKKLNSEANSAVKSQIAVSGLSSFITSTINSIYPAEKFSSDVNKIIDSNYRWLDGQSAKPNFALNLVSPKQNLANKADAYVISSTQNLPLCSELQQIELQNYGPMSENCLPPSLLPKKLASNIRSDILNSSAFSNQPYLTADSIKINNGKPYYQKLSAAPKYYHWATKSLYFLIGSLLIVTLLIFLIHPLKRAAYKLISSAILISGLLSLLSNLVINVASEKLVARAGTSQTLTDFHKPVNSFINGLSASIIKINRESGLLCIATSIVLFIFYIIYRKLIKIRANDIIYTKSGGEGGI